MRQRVFHSAEEFERAYFPAKKKPYLDPDLPPEEYGKRLAEVLMNELRKALGVEA
jgi:hypothetical protein